MESLNNNESSSNWKYLLPISLIVFLVPLIVFMKVIELTPIEIAYWKGGTTNPDFFSYYKMIALNTFTAMAMISTYFYFKKKDIKIEKINIYIPMVAYAILTILSTLMAEYTGVALWGFVDRYEGMFASISYLIIMFIAINIIDDEKSVKAIIYPLMASATIIGLIGVFQYLGYDFFQTSFGKRMILPSEHINLVESLQFNFGKNTIYSTLYNTNYVGSYMAMLFSIALTLLILIKDKKKKLILIPVTILMFLNLVGSNSRGGMLGTAAGMLILLLMIRKQIFKNWKIVVLSILILSVGVNYVNKVSEGRLTGQVTRLKSDIMSAINGEKRVEDPEAYKIKDVSSVDNTLKIETTRETLKMEIKDGEINFLDESDTIIPVEYDGETGVIKLTDVRYEQYNLKMVSDGEITIVELNLAGYITKFGILDEGFKYYIGKGVTKDIKDIESYGFEGKEALGSGRGYIWSRSIPMLKENIILGNGPDTYAIYFPQEDFKGKFNTQSLAYGTIVDKPHNLYMQIASNTGVLSLIAFLAIVIMYLFKSTKIYFKNGLEDNMAIIGLALFIAVIGYMVAGVFNDSVISVAPVFWVLLGTGVAVNMKVVENED